MRCINCGKPVKSGEFYCPPCKKHLKEIGFKDSKKLW